MLDPGESQVIERLEAGGLPALAEQFAMHRQELVDLINAQITPQLSGRIDGSDVVQEAYIKALQEFDHYIAEPTAPIASWLRRICLKTLSANFRRHILAARRSLNSEAVQLDQSGNDSNDEEPVLFAKSSPSSIVKQAEARQQLVNLILSMKEIDRSIIVARHIDAISFREAAVKLNIPYETARKRYRRAVKRLSELAQKLL